MTELVLAEVIGINNYQIGNAFSIAVKTISDNTPCTYNDVIPVSLNDLKIPLIGEHVVIFKGISKFANKTNTPVRWYYLTTYNLQSSINHSISPGVSYDARIKTEIPTSTNQTFIPNRISAMQPYEGDNIYQGRFGNSLRFGSSNEKHGDNAFISPTWVEGTAGDPIIILSNTKRNTPGLVVENYGDYSGLWLSSTQRFNGFKLHYNLKESTGKDSTNTTNVSQFFGIADRVILHAKSDVVAVDSQRAIEMRAPKLVIGSNKEKYGILDSRTVMDALFTLRSLIAYGLEGPASQKISLSEYGREQSAKLMNLLLNLTNDDILIDRKDNV